MATDLGTSKVDASRDGVVDVAQEAGPANGNSRRQVGDCFGHTAREGAWGPFVWAGTFSETAGWFRWFIPSVAALEKRWVRGRLR